MTYKTSFLRWAKKNFPNNKFELKRNVHDYGVIVYVNNKKIGRRLFLNLKKHDRYPERWPSWYNSILSSIVVI